MNASEGISIKFINIYKGRTRKASKRVSLIQDMMSIPGLVYCFYSAYPANCCIGSNLSGPVFPPRPGRNLTVWGLALSLGRYECVLQHYDRMLLPLLLLLVLK